MTHTESADIAPDNPIVAKQFVHSTHLRSKLGSAVMIKEKIKYADGTIKPNLIVYENPKRSFFVTQLKYRNYKYKPEYELASRLDKFTCFDHDLSRKVASLFNLGYGYVDRGKLFKSPYIFGADISIEALMKMRYIDDYPDANMTPTVGFLDIETSIDTDQIILISYTYGNIVHTAILQSYLYEEIGGKRVPVSKGDLLKHIQVNLASRTKGLTLTYDLEIFDSEIKLIAWILKHVHASQIDFIGIWNMNFDIPRILSAVGKHNYDPASLFSSPLIPKKYQYLRYYEDPRPVPHFTLKWHWLYSTCGSQFLDSMGLYSQCRRTAGFRDKYDLNSVLQDEIGQGKLDLTNGSHVIMQRHHFKDYVVYNIFDVVGLRLLEDKNNDILSMAVLSGPTPVNKFSTQTIRSTNAMYHSLIGKGMVLSSYSAEDDFTKFDRLISNTGGAVLSTDRVRGVGIKLTI